MNFSPVAKTQRYEWTTVPTYISQVVAPAGHRVTFLGFVDREVSRTGRWASSLASSSKSLSTSMKTRKPRPGFASTIARVHNSPHQVSDHFFFLFISAIFFPFTRELETIFFPGGDYRIVTRNHGPGIIMANSPVIHFF